jgi:PAS domain S-box-containing protein
MTIQRGSGTIGTGGRRLNVESVAARVLLDATSIEDAASGILQAICESLAWDHGALWTVDHETDSLQCAQMWSASPSRVAEFRTVSQNTGFGRGIGLPGRVWETAAPAWIPDVVGAANFPRGPVAAREGLHAAFGFPVLLRGEVFGVMEFFSREILAADENLLATLTTVGNQIGIFIERQRAREELSRFFALSLDMLCVAGLDGYLKRVNPAWQHVLGYSEEELLSRPYIEFVHPDDVEATRAAATKLSEGQPIVHLENRYLHKDGSPRWLLWAAAPPAAGQQVVYGTARDITERKAAEQLRARAANLELLDALLHALVESGDLPDVFGRISEVARKVLTHDAVALMVRLPDGVHARVYASTGFPLDLPKITEVPEELLRDPNWEHHILDDLGRLPEPRYVALVKMGFHSLIRVPLRLDEQFAGALIFFSRSISAFEPADVLVARRMADRMAIAVAHDREIQATKRAAEATERASHLEARVRALTEELDARTGYRRVVGESRQWRQVLTQATQVASTDTTVLLLGESGTGKEVVARFLHRGSPRSKGPFIALNCAALPEQLLEAELFGYERGAYTGATQSKPGQLEQAAGGTLFLDEVAEMSPSAQAKFLRVLQEREFQRLGGTRVLRTDARVVAATNRDLQRGIANGQFREDLFYRLNVFAIRLPPLRDRRDDILPLSDAFLAEIGRGLGRPPAGISRDARELLVEYHFPGNVRELRNILERAAILCDGGLITTEHLALNISPSPITVSSPPVTSALSFAASPPRSMPPPASMAVPPSAVAAASDPTSPVRPQSAADLQTIERGMIEQALQAARFNKSKAAKALGLTRHQLYIRMRKYGLEP